MSQDLRDQAVALVDQQHHYTIEFAPDQAYHAFEYDTVEHFLRALDERLLDMATEPLGLLFSVEEYVRWAQTGTLGHCQRNRNVQAAVAASWQDATHSTEDPQGIQAMILHYQAG